MKLKDEEIVDTVLVPFGDLINHSNPPHVSWGWEADEEGRKGWFGRANRDIMRGENVYISYGNKSNYNLLLDYGFLIPENKASLSNILRLKLNTDDPLFEVKKEILGSGNIDVFLKTKPSPEALSIFRIAFFDDTDNLQQLKDIKDVYA